MGARITNASLTIQTLIHAGFRSTASAIAELVDNSIEANSLDIRIIATNKKTFVKTSTQNNIHELAVLDDGHGMNLEELGRCLSLGWGTHLDKHEGLGKFGFGLKGSSISQCRMIEVYSWQNGHENCHLITMDINKIIEEDLEELPDPQPSSLPQIYKTLFRDNFGNSGTLVRWQDLATVDVKKTDALVRRLNSELCRIYRHYLDDDDDYGTRRNIQVVTIESGDKTISNETPLLANDPLYLLTPSNVEGYEQEAIFEKWGDDYEIDIETEEGLSKVEFRSSIARPEIQLLGGASKVGKHCDGNTGISFLRTAREIDFGSFSYIDGFDTRNRWWGLEVRFEPVLDEIFGVTNNKQYVRNVIKLSANKRDEYAYTVDLENNDLDYYKAKGLLEIDRHVDKLVKEMMAIVKTRGKAKRIENPETDTSAKVNKELENDSTPTQSARVGSAKTTEEKSEALTELFKRSDQGLTDSEAVNLAKDTINYKVDLLFDTWPGKLFLDLKFPANGAVGIINRDHNFFDIFWNHLEGSTDPKALEAMNIMLMAYVHAEDEQVLKHSTNPYADLRDSWGRWLHQLLNISN